MAISLTVSSRTINPDGSVQYQFDDGTGVMFDSIADEEAWCVESDIEVQMRGDMIRIAVCKTVHGLANATVTLNIDDANGDVLKVA